MTGDNRPAMAVFGLIAAIFRLSRDPWSELFEKGM
jgi:hypothetical protein